eukprot:TRINITY_DN3614_c0_g1_i1.p2 TRINITY_DN3614_c0_g1~~TRINITY_DN3614_c0_g1_i1.p2  ORF type:complete len:209 (-),score=65.15 TRINITY_DN3614_c0_g1_i1:29-655(-)
MSIDSEAVPILINDNKTDNNKPLDEQSTPSTSTTDMIPNDEVAPVQSEDKGLTVVAEQVSIEKVEPQTQQQPLELSGEEGKDVNRVTVSYFGEEVDEEEDDFITESFVDRIERAQDEMKDAMKDDKAEIERAELLRTLSMTDFRRGSQMKPQNWMMGTARRTRTGKVEIGTSGVLAKYTKNKSGEVVVDIVRTKGEVEDGGEKVNINF